MSGCKLLDKGQEVVHFGHKAGEGVFIARDEATGSVTICRHPGGDVRQKPDFEKVFTSEEFAQAGEHIDDVPVDTRGLEVEPAEEKPAEEKPAETEPVKTGDTLPAGGDGSTETDPTE